MRGPWDMRGEGVEVCVCVDAMKSSSLSLFLSRLCTAIFNLVLNIGEHSAYTLQWSNKHYPANETNQWKLGTRGERVFLPMFIKTKITPDCVMEKETRPWETKNIVEVFRDEVLCSIVKKPICRIFNHRDSSLTIEEITFGVKHDGFQLETFTGHRVGLNGKLWVIGIRGKDRQH